MKFEKTKSLVVAVLGAGVLATVTWLPQARGELVYENPAAANSPRADERESVRQILTTSQKAQATVQSVEPPTVTQVAIQPAAPVVTVPVGTQAVAAPAVISQPAPVQPAPMVMTAVPTPVTPSVAPAQVEIQNLSKSELMRRERVREELKNEDILQERLEELRLRDERHRTEQLLGAAPAGADAVKPAAPVQNEIVTTPVTERPGQPAAVPQVPVTLASNSAPVQQDQVRSSQSSSVSVLPASTGPSTEDKVIISVMPRGGVANMSGNGGFNVQSKYAGGIGLGVGVSDNLSFDVGYQYAEYGVAMTSTNPYVQYAQMTYPGYGTNPSFTTLALKQNVIDAGLKLHFLGPDARVRPFIGGGGAYSKSFLNYDQGILDKLQSMGIQNPSTDYEMSQFLGYLSAGMDIRLSKNVSVGALFKYYAVVSARENQPLNPAGFYAPGLTNGYGYQNAVVPQYGSVVYDEKQTVGSSLTKSSFYSVLAGVTFSF